MIIQKQTSKHKSLILDHCFGAVLCGFLCDFLVNPNESSFEIRQIKNPQTLDTQRLAGGAGNVTRTHDLLITNQLLYRLSYTSMAAFSER